ncbi:MAG: redoxin domain-containing protein [Clostridiales bacterium]|jgi:peroxiredoxin (alkyl hydroperoxide reductase subunit C)|nr:redoxin domain-containing protein [Clostridiales bacterium]
MNIGCSKPSASINEAEEANKIITKEYLKEDKKNMIKVGKPAPTFTAPAYHKGNFTNVNLEDYKGKWVLLCFYPGDFTFV